MNDADRKMLDGWLISSDGIEARLPGTEFTWFPIPRAVSIEAYARKQVEAAVMAEREAIRQRVKAMPIERLEERNFADRVDAAIRARSETEPEAPE